jgi:hypothetical protein
MRGIFLVDFLKDRTIFLFLVSIEGALMRRIESGKRPAPPVRVRSHDLGRLWVTVRGHYEPLPSMAGMENPVRRKKRLRLKSSVPKGSRGLRKKSAGSRKRGPGALWEERRSRALRDDRFLERGASRRPLRFAALSSLDFSPA